MWKSGSLKAQFIIIICLATLLLVGILSIVIISTANESQSEQANAFIQSLQSEQEQEEELLRQGLFQKVESIAALLAQTASYLIMNYNFELLQQLADNVTRDPDIEFVTFYGEGQEPLARAPDQREDVEEIIRRDILEGEDVIGFVEIGFNCTCIDNAISDLSERIEKLVQGTRAKRAASTRSFTFRLAISAGIGIVLLSVGIYLSFSRLITKPLLTVSNTAHRLGSFDLTGNVESNRNDEIGALFRAINEMVRSLRKVISQVQRSGIQVTSSATELSATAKEQDAIMANQVESTNNVVNSIHGISDITTELVQTMETVASMSQETAGFASSGQADLARMEEAMQHMEDASRTISGRLQAISEKAENITNVVTTITKVADQTNLLSLNAAIEAEKAGEYGRGFTVVAREIRRLADQTAVATLDIEQMVAEMQSAVSAGVTEMDKFIAEVQRSVEDVEKISTQLTRIIEQVQALSPNFEDVTEAMQFQSKNAQQINAAMISLSEEMQQTRDSLHETYSAIEQLNEAAKGLQNEVSRFKVE